MEGGVLWRADVMERSCAVARGKDINNQNKTVGFGQRPRPLHNRYTRTDTCVRWAMAVTYNRYKFVTVLLLKRLRNGRFASETAVRSRSG